MNTRITLPKLSFCICLLIALIVIGSCQKDENSDENSSKWKKLATWYETNHKVSAENAFSVLEPDWRTVRVKEDNNIIVYEISLKSPNDVMIFANRAKSMKPEQEKSKHAIKLLLFENKAKSKIMYGAYMSIESKTIVPNNIHYKEFGQLSGTILYNHFNGTFANGWQYEKGKLMKQFINMTKEDYEKANRIKQGGKTSELVCVSGYVDVYVWGCTGTEGNMTCGYHYNSTRYFTQCWWENEGMMPELENPGSGPGGSSGGYSGAVFVDCDGVENGDATFVVDCNECIGGTTGKTVCTVLDTTNHITNPCLNDAMNIALGKGVNSRIKSLMTNTFLANSNVNLDFYSFSFNPNGPDANADANARASGNNPLNQTISLNESRLLGASKEFVVATIYHEVLHAYLANLFPRNSTGSFLIPNDHQYIVDNFLNMLITDLRSQFPSLSEQDAWGLAWGGLDNDSPRYQLLMPQAKQQIIDANNAYRNKPQANGSVTGASKGKYCP